MWEFTQNSRFLAFLDNSEFWQYWKRVVWKHLGGEGWHKWMASALPLGKTDRVEELA